MAQQTKDKNKLSKFEKYVLDRISVRLFEKTYDFWSGLLGKYNKYLQKRILTKHVDELLVDITDHNLNAIYRGVLQNQINTELTKLAALGDGTKKGLTPKQLISIAKYSIDTYHELESIIGIQPMQGPVGLVDTIEYVNSKKDEFQTDPNPAVEGSTDKMALNVISHAVESGTRKTEAAYSVEAAHDMDMVHGLDIAEEICKAVGAEVGYGFINEVITDLTRLAGIKRTIDMKPTEEDILVDDRHSQIAVAINQIANEIARKTRRGSGNFVVTSPIIVSMLQSASKAVFAPASVRPGRPKSTFDLMFVGTLNGTIKIYSTLHPDLQTSALVGYKGGNGQTDTGYILCPYVPVLETGVVINPDTYTPQMGFMTRYGKHGRTSRPDGKTPLSHSSNYYGMLHITGLFDKFDGEEKEADAHPLAKVTEQLLESIEKTAPPLI